MIHRARWAGGGLLLVLLLAPLGAQDASAIYRNAEAAFGDKAYDKALVGFRAFAEKYPDDSRAPRALHRIGESHGALGHHEQAAAAFQLCYQRYPDSNVADSAMFNEGFYYFRAQMWQPAAFSYFRYIKQGGNAVYKAQAWYWRAEAFYQLRRFSDAIAAYEGLLTQPNDALQHPAVAELVPYARYSIAVSHYENKDYDKALAAVKTVLDKHPSAPVRPDAMWYGAQALRQLKRLDEAVDWYTRLATEQPKSNLAPDALYAAFEIENARGRKAEAQRIMDRLSRDYPDAGALAKGARFRLAAQQLQARNYAEAQRLYREALVGATGETEAAGLLGLAEASFALEQWGEAATAYRSLLTRHPKDSAVPRARLRLGEALLHQGKPAEAETVYRELLKAQPSAADALLARYNLALALHQQGQKDAAATLFAEVARLDPRGETGASALLEVGRHAMDQQRYAEARTAYQDFLRRAPQAAEAAQAWWGVGEASYGLKDWPRASDAYQTLIDKFPRHALVERAYYRLIEVYRAQGQGEQADKLAATLRQRFPGSDLSAATLLTTGREAFKAKRYAAASEAFESFLKSYPEHADAGVATANLAASLYLAEELPDHWRRAAEAYAQLARKYPTVSDDALFWAGSAWLEAGQPEPASEALRAFLKAQTAHRYGPRGRLLLGKSLVAQKHHAEACSLLEEVVAAAKDDPALRSEARYELAWALLADGKEDAAYRVFEAIVNDDPRGPLGADARFRLASRAYQKKEYDQAIAGSQEWLQLYPQHALRPKVVYNLAFAQEAKSQYGPAAESYEEAARLLTGGDEDLRQQAAYRRGLMLHRAGNPAGALAAFEIFDTTWPQSKLRVEVAYYRGQALAAQEKWDEAATVFRRLTETAASHALAPSARLNLAVALQNQQKYEEARVLYQSLVTMTGLSPAEQTEALLHLGETLYAQRHHAEALDAFLRVERGPVTALRAPARYWAALCYQHQGETAKAREKLHLVINESPDTDWAKKAKQALTELGT